ncbi:hypothetical protein HDV01_000955 [Terramyces sp. JEL0728]|nr:hypothetical protein HDV01_000955 [Terramyces sp. JEL0728]
MALLLVVAQSHFIINNIFEGLIWFVLPCALVVCNDIMAYVSGFFLGKTPLIKISPKKTWEGWIAVPFHFIFPSVVSAEPIRAMTVLPIQLHALVFGLFASLIAPFGGFFASGLKRAFNIKDFADSIPGHGGLTDRMDCQFIMGVFASLYYHSFVGRVGMTVGTVLELALQSLDTQNLVQLYVGLGKYLEGQGVEF